jgi:hypothetical protein
LRTCSSKNQNAKDCGTKSLRDSKVLASAEYSKSRTSRIEVGRTKNASFVCFNAAFFFFLVEQLTMKEVVVYEGPQVELIDSSIPRASANQVVIQVEVSGTNPKDWKTWWVPNLPVNMGDDMAGIIHEVGAGVTDFKVGVQVLFLILETNVKPGG